MISRRNFIQAIGATIASYFIPAKADDLGEKLHIADTFTTDHVIFNHDWQGIVEKRAGYAGFDLYEFEYENYDHNDFSIPVVPDNKRIIGIARESGHIFATVNDGRCFYITEGVPPGGKWEWKELTIENPDHVVWPKNLRWNSGWEHISNYSMKNVRFIP